MVNLSRHIPLIFLILHTLLTLAGLGWALLIGAPWLSVLFAGLWSLAALIYRNS